MKKKLKNTDILASRIGSGLAELRKSRKLTQEELAQRLGTKQEAISKIESGAAIPSWEYISRMLKALDAEVEIRFKLMGSEDTSHSVPSIKDQEYVCINCLYQWESELKRDVIQCPRCHKRQGVLYSEYTKTLKAFQEIQLAVKKSPPFKAPPPLRSLSKNMPQLLKMVLSTAGNTFPSPRLPVSLLFRIMENTMQKQQME